MSLNNTPSAERTHIGIFGRRNAGKSSIINALTGQDLAIVSEVRGTTTDPVLKAMELLPLGPVVMIDTPGLDDEGALGELRVKKAYQILNKTDIAVLVVDGTVGMTDEDRAILDRIRGKGIPYVIVMNKADLAPAAREGGVYGGAAANTTGTNATGTGTADTDTAGTDTADTDTADINTKCTDAADRDTTDTNTAGTAKSGQTLWVSTRDKTNIHELKELIARLVPDPDAGRQIAGDLVEKHDLVVLVIPIDKAAPKGRLILPQQQTIRDLLEAGAVPVVTRETELKETLASLGKKPALVITDSQAFEQVARDVPEDIPLTSFSILFARYKGNLRTLAGGASALDTLKDGDTVLISEGCTHHRQCDDIGTVKLPSWIKKYTGANPCFEFTSGTEFPEDLGRYKLIIHCGGCTLNEREVRYRLKCAEDAGVPITNYGTAIAYMKGILGRSTAMFAL